MEDIVTPHFRLSFPQSSFDVLLFNFVVQYTMNDDYYFSNIRTYYDNSFFSSLQSFIEFRKSSARMSIENQQYMMDICTVSGRFIGCAGFIKVNRLISSRDAYLCVHLLAEYSANDFDEILHVICKISINSKFKLSVLRANLIPNFMPKFKKLIEESGFMQVSINEYCLMIHNAFSLRSFQGIQTKFQEQISPNHFFQLCADCGGSFEMTTSEMRFYQSRELRPPKRCPDCRMKKRSLQSDSPSNFSKAYPHGNSGIIIGDVRRLDNSTSSRTISDRYKHLNQSLITSGTSLVNSPLSMHSPLQKVNQYQDKNQFYQDQDQDQDQDQENSSFNTPVKSNNHVENENKADINLTSESNTHQFNEQNVSNPELNDKTDESVALTPNRSEGKVCSYWLHGYCRYGSACRNIHGSTRVLPYLSTKLGMRISGTSNNNNIRSQTSNNIGYQSETVTREDINIDPSSTTMRLQNEIMLVDMLNTAPASWLLMLRYEEVNDEINPNISNDSKVREEIHRRDESETRISSVTSMSSVDNNLAVFSSKNISNQWKYLSSTIVYSITESRLHSPYTMLENLRHQVGLEKAFIDESFLKLNQGVIHSYYTQKAIDQQRQAYEYYLYQNQKNLSTHSFYPKNSQSQFVLMPYPIPNQDIYQSSYPSSYQNNVSGYTYPTMHYPVTYPPSGLTTLAPTNSPQVDYHVETELSKVNLVNEEPLNLKKEDKSTYSSDTHNLDPLPNDKIQHTIEPEMISIMDQLQVSSPLPSVQSSSIQFNESQHINDEHPLQHVDVNYPDELTKTQQGLSKRKGTARKSGGNRRQTDKLKYNSKNQSRISKGDIVSESLE